MRPPSANELREHYRRLSTDELLAISIGSDLTDLARELIEEELSKRGVTDDDLAHAKRTHAVTKAQREPSEATRVKCYIVGIFFIFIGVLMTLAGGSSDFCSRPRPLRGPIFSLLCLFGPRGYGICMIVLGVLGIWFSLRAWSDKA